MRELTPLCRPANNQRGIIGEGAARGELGQRLKDLLDYLFRRVYCMGSDDVGHPIKAPLDANGVERLR
jgi:hypothetical protein